MSFDNVKAKFKDWFGRSYDEVKSELHVQRDKVATVTWGAAFWVSVGCLVLGYVLGRIH